EGVGCGSPLVHVEVGGVGDVRRANGIHRTVGAHTDHAVAMNTSSSSADLLVHGYEPARLAPCVQVVGLEVGGQVLRRDERLPPAGATRPRGLVQGGTIAPRLEGRVLRLRQQIIFNLPADGAPGVTTILSLPDLGLGGADLNVEVSRHGSTSIDINALGSPPRQSLLHAGSESEEVTPNTVSSGAPLAHSFSVVDR